MMAWLVGWRAVEFIGWARLSFENGPWIKGEQRCARDKVDDQAVLRRTPSLPGCPVLRSRTGVPNSGNQRGRAPFTSASSCMVAVTSSQCERRSGIKPGGKLSGRSSRTFYSGPSDKGRTLALTR